MADSNLKPGNLGAGEFYGTVPEKRVVRSSILSEVVHSDALDLPEHSHELAYFTLVLGGSYFERFGANATDHKPMSMIWHRAGISHKDRIGVQGARCFMVEIQPNGIDSIRQFSQVPLDFAEYGTSLTWLAARLFHEFKNWQDCSELVAEGLTLEMLGYSARKTASGEKQQPKWLGRVVEKLKEDFSKNISTDDLAAAAQVHPVHLAAVFRKFHGKTMGEFVQQLRVTHASKLMTERDRTLADIAYESGFSDQSHLTRLFKRHTGMTPGAFRTSLN
jgi:AraC family transcriptional regulator